MIEVEDALFADLDPVVADYLRQHGNQLMGVTSSYSWWDDPKRVMFSLARYKFVSKMIEGRQCALEVGCGDGFASRIVSQAVGSLVAVDLSKSYVLSAQQSAAGQWPIAFRQHDIMAAPVEGAFDAAYSLDVLEHIPQPDEHRFISNMIAPLKQYGICIIGMPSLQSQSHASKLSKQNHINCKDQKDLKKLLETYFNVVLAFSANDEMIHTGYHAMAHYNIVVCVAKK